MSNKIQKSNSVPNLSECKCDLLKNVKEDTDESEEEISFEEERYRIFYPKKELFETAEDRLIDYRPDDDRADDIIASSFKRSHVNEPREPIYKPYHYEEVIPKPIRLPETFLNSKMFRHMDLKNRNVLFYEKDGRKFLLVEWKPLKLTHEQIDKVLEYKRKGLDLWSLDFLQVPKPSKEMDVKVDERTTFMADDLYLADDLLYKKKTAVTCEDEGKHEEARQEGKDEKKQKSLICLEKQKEMPEEKDSKKKFKKEKSAEMICKLEEQEEPREEQFVKKPLDRDEILDMIHKAGFKPHERKILLIDRDREFPRLDGRLLLADSLHFVKDNSAYLLELKDAIYYLGKVMKHVFESYIEEGFTFLARTSRVVVNKKSLFREMRIFSGLYKRLSNACRNFLQIYIEEYRRHMFIIKAEAEKFIKNIKILIDFQPKEILEKYDNCMKEFVEYLEKDDKQMMSMKGLTWDDSPKFRDKYSRFKTFEQKSAWVIDLMLEVLEEIKVKYILDRGDDEEDEDDLHETKSMTAEEEIEFLREYLENDEERKPRRKQHAKPFDFHPL